VARRIEPAPAGWIDAAADAAQLGNVRVRVASVGLEPVEPVRPDASRTRPEKRLVVRLRVSNAGASRAEHYRGWNGFLGDPAYGVVLLRDDLGNQLRPSSRTPAAAGKKIQHAEIPPEKWVDDFLVFEAPASRPNALQLQLPGDAVGSKEKLLSRIPADRIHHLFDGPAAKPGFR
jgi:hypothetical protein